MISVPHPSGRPTVVGDVTVTVHASDVLTATGAATILGGHTGIRVLDADGPVGPDARLVIEDGLGDLATLRRAVDRYGTGPGCVLLAEAIEPSGLRYALEAGVTAVLPHAEMTGPLLAPELLASPGKRAVSSMLELRAAVERWRQLKKHAAGPGGQLTDRERQVLRLLAEGRDTAEIGRLLNYSERTVKKTVHGLMQRHGFRNRAHAVAFAIRAGVI